MFIALLKTVDNQIAVETDTLSKALGILQSFIDKGDKKITEACVLEEIEELDDQCPDFSSCKLIATLRTMK
jgi:hypothetical protein